MKKMFDCNKFISDRQNMLIAPAGFGKTHTIAKCLKQTEESGKSLVLTHTHAGVATLKEKIRKEGVDPLSYVVTTITSYAQKFVLSFYTGDDIPPQEDDKNYYPFTIENAAKILAIKPILRILSDSYIALYVDEYQDCTKKQHELILLISKSIPTHILGDPLQAIFGFNEPSVDMDDPSQMQDFYQHKYQLDTPFRWLKGGDEGLGNDLKNLRKHLERRERIVLGQFGFIEQYNVAEGDIYKPYKSYNKKINNILYERSVLLIHPNSINNSSRIKIIQRFPNRLELIEAIDGREYYKLAKLADDMMSQGPYMEKLLSILEILFNETRSRKWFNRKGVVNKTKKDDAVLISPIKDLLDVYANAPTFDKIANLLMAVENLPKMNCYRANLLEAFHSALIEASTGKLTVYEAMVQNRNLIRREGRKVHGRCIGTTLLTKGLEFDTVVILNAHRFKCPKNLYVAMTRASKRLVIFSQGATLHPYPTG